jgi:hypothetical protein
MLFNCDRAASRLGYRISRTYPIRKIMAADNFPDPKIWERLEQGRKIKAAQGGYAGYGSPPFGHTAVNGELVENPPNNR